MKISAGDYEAKIRTTDGGLSELKFQNRNLIEPYNEMDGKFGGALLAPWPNRVRDGRYSINGKEYQLPINEIERNNALHGLINKLNWQVSDQSVSQVTLESTLLACDFYPSTLKMKVNYQINPDGLAWSLSGKNLGSVKVPYGASIHPYFIADPGSRVDEWFLRLSANEVLDVDLERLLPLKLVSVEDMNFDFRSGSLIGHRFIDHAFKVLDSTFGRQVSVIAKNGIGVKIEFDQSSGWIQIHTADRDGRAGSRSCLALEPMSCPPDAFNSGVDLIWLMPGDEQKMAWKINAIG